MKSNLTASWWKSSKSRGMSLSSLCQSTSHSSWTITVMSSTWMAARRYHMQEQGVSSGSGCHSSESAVAWPGSTAPAVRQSRDVAMPSSCRRTAGASCALSGTVQSRTALSPSYSCFTGSCRRTGSASVTASRVFAHIRTSILVLLVCRPHSLNWRIAQISTRSWHPSTFLLTCQ